MRPDQNEDAELKFKIMNGSAWLFWRSCMTSLSIPPPAPRTDVYPMTFNQVEA